MDLSHHAGTIAGTMAGISASAVAASEGTVTIQTGVLLGVCTAILGAAWIAAKEFAALTGTISAMNANLTNGLADNRDDHRHYEEKLEDHAERLSRLE